VEGGIEANIQWSDLSGAIRHPEQNPLPGAKS